MDGFALKLSAVAAVLVSLGAGQVQVRHEKEPEFLAPLENLTVTQGRDVYFTCVVNHLQTYKVAWIKSDTKTILAIHTHMVALNPRLSVSHNGHDTWKLYISSVQANDSGTYMCQVNTDPMRSQMGHLAVVIPPDIVDEETDEPGALTTAEGGALRLHCSATGVPPPQVAWRRDGGRSIFERDPQGNELRASATVGGETLVLQHVRRMDMGAYNCIASNGVPPTVSKRFDVKVLFPPMVRVSSQLVAAPRDTDATLQCYAEASPKAMNSWLRDTGEELLPGAKYRITETALNEYALLMNLTVRQLDKPDFGSYTCASVNALGRAEGTVRLQEIVLPPKTTTTTTTTTTSTSTTTSTTAATTIGSTARPRKKQGKKQGDKKLTNHILDDEDNKDNKDNKDIRDKSRPTSRPQWRNVDSGCCRTKATALALLSTLLLLH